MASRQNAEIMVPNYLGGQASAKGISTLTQNEFAVMDNVVLKAQGTGFRNREGNTALNATAVASGAAITGLGYLKSAAGNEYLLATAGSGIYVDTNFSGTFSDKTGSLTVTSNQNNQWSFFQSNNTLIGVGGAPNAPFKYTGSGNAALLGGSPPTGRYGFSYGNRTFIMSTVADPSTIYWSVILEPENWSGDGSGNADVEPDDGDSLVTAAPINLNTVILFKKNSIHLMTGRESPFPIFPLFRGIGCVGKHACVVYKGLAYFVTTDARMAVTDGNTIVEFPHLPDMSDVWASFNTTRLPYIQGTIISAPDFDWIVWSATKTEASMNDYAAIWDLRNQCWLTCSTGFEANAYVVTGGNVPYMGGYDGKVYRQFAAGTHTDASNASEAVAFRVESDWITLGQLLSVKQVNRASILIKTQGSGTMTFSYGYDYLSTLKDKTFSVATMTGALWDDAEWDDAQWDGYNGAIKNITTYGRGNAFKWRLTGSSDVAYEVSQVSLFGKNKSQREFNAVV